MPREDARGNSFRANDAWQLAANGEATDGPIGAIAFAAGQTSADRCAPLPIELSDYVPIQKLSLWPARVAA